MEEKNTFLLNFTMRMIVGMGLILLINYLLEENGIDLQVGWNGISALVTGFLGVPGVAMMYGIVAFPIL